MKSSAIASWVATGVLTVTGAGAVTHIMTSNGGSTASAASSQATGTMGATGTTESSGTTGVTGTVGTTGTTGASSTPTTTPILHQVGGSSGFGDDSSNEDGYQAQEGFGDDHGSSNESVYTGNSGTSGSAPGTWSGESEGGQGGDD